jgi:AraC-like DNA-binding protein
VVVAAAAQGSSIVERRGPRGRLGWLVMAGHRIQRRQRSEATARFPLFGATLVSQGVGRYRDEHHDLAVGPGDLVLVVPGHPHRYGPDAGGWEERYLAFSGPLFQLAAGCGLIDIANPVHRLGPVERWAARFDHFRRCPAPASPAACDAEAAMILALIADMVGQASPSGTGGSQPDDAWLARSIELLGGDLGRSLAPAEVAAAVGMAHETWRRAFRAAVGVPPARFRLDRRLAAAAELLVTTSSSVRTIASSLGFTDDRHLNARFVESYGCTPTAYRRRGAGPRPDPSDPPRGPGPGGRPG